MRIVSYNILDGGGGRADTLADVIRSQRPDVVCLAEAEDEPVLATVANGLEMDFVSAPGRKGGSALMTRWTIRESVNHALLRNALTKSLLEATVVTPAGEEWAFGVVHLHAHAREQDERKREEELEVVLDVFAGHRRDRRPHILCGDFNANAPTQHIDLPNAKTSTREEWERNGRQIPRRVVQRILDAGYVDSLRAVRGEEADRTYSFTTEHPGQRVDYIFAHGIDPRRMQEAWVLRNEAAERASDHFPVGLDIQ